jgi:hypothetical protein
MKQTVKESIRQYCVYFQVQGTARKRDMSTVYYDTFVEMIDDKSLNQWDKEATKTKIAAVVLEQETEYLAITIDHYETIWDVGEYLDDWVILV